MIYFHTLHKIYRFTKPYFKASSGTKETVNERIIIQCLNKVLGETNKATNKTM